MVPWVATVGTKGQQSEPMRHSEKKTTSSKEKQKSSCETKSDAFNTYMFDDLTIHVCIQCIP